MPSTLTSQGAREEKTIKSLQVYRGVAAVLVVLFHLQLILRKHFEEAWWANLAIFGRNGVQFFFVLSGFIIYHAHARELGQPKFIGSYLLKRFTRVYPPYWVVTLALAPFWVLFADFGEPYHKSFSALVCSLLLIPQEHSPHLEVAWTLIFEIFFYLAFTLLFFSRRWLWAGFAWIAAIIANEFLGFATSPAAKILFAPENLLFIAGVGIGMWHRRWERPQWLAGWSIVLGVLLFIGGAVFTYQGYYCALPVPATLLAGTGRTLYFGLAAALLVFGCGVPAIENRFFTSRALLALGGASYSLYLVHYPVLSFASKVVKMIKGPTFLPNGYIYLLLAYIAIVAGVLFHLLIEKPLLKAIKSLLRPRAARPEPALVSLTDNA